MRLVLIIFFIFLLNYLAMEFYWYSSIWYLDMPMHFLGGVWLGFVSIYFLLPKEISLKFIFKILSIVVFIGAGWEVFEILIDKFVTQDYFNYLDTISDISFDIAGGLFALLYFLKRIMSLKRSAVYGLP